MQLMVARTQPVSGEGYQEASYRNHCQKHTETSQPIRHLLKGEIVAWQGEHRQRILGVGDVGCRCGAVGIDGSVGFSGNRESCNRCSGFVVGVLLLYTLPEFADRRTCRSAAGARLGADEHGLLVVRRAGQ